MVFSGPTTFAPVFPCFDTEGILFYYIIPGRIFCMILICRNDSVNIMPSFKDSNLQADTFFSSFDGVWQEILCT